MSDPEGHEHNALPREEETAERTRGRIERMEHEIDWLKERLDTTQDELRHAVGHLTSIRQKGGG